MAARTAISGAVHGVDLGKVMVPVEMVDWAAMARRVGSSGRAMSDAALEALCQETELNGAPGSAREALTLARAYEDVFADEVERCRRMLGCEGMPCQSTRHGTREGTGRGGVSS